MFHIFLLSKLTIQNSLRYYFVLSKFLDSDSIQTWHDVSPIWKKYIYGQRFWRLKYFENILNDIKCAPLLSHRGTYQKGIKNKLRVLYFVFGIKSGH